MIDFVLFESLYNSTNHCIDLCIIARLLKDSGYSVAIADVFHEAECCKVDGIPHIQISHKCRASLKLSVAKTTIVRYSENLSNRYIIDLYLCKVVKELSPLAKNFYVGTLMIGMPFMWLKKLPANKKVFFWGLRSYYLTYYRLKKIKYETFSSKVLSNYFFNNDNIRLFVSDDIIRSEFLSLGFKSNQLVLRPERMIETINIPNPEADKKYDICNILCIGTLRPHKRVDVCLQALISMQNPEIHITVAGKGSQEKGYNERINSLIKKCPNAKRIDKRLNDEEYNSLMNSCDYLLLCDEKQLSSVTNGTMLEALLMGKPIIAPNYEPYKTTIENFNVGILYDINDHASISMALQLALGSSKSIYIEGLNKFRSKFVYHNVLSTFKKEIKIAIES